MQRRPLCVPFQPSLMSVLWKTRSPRRSYIHNSYHGVAIGMVCRGHYRSSMMLWVCCWRLSRISSVVYLQVYT